MDESSFAVSADATLERIGLALDAALETSNAEFDWTLTDGCLVIEHVDARIEVRRDVGARVLRVFTSAGALRFRGVRGRWQDEDEELGETLARILRTQLRVSVRMPELPAP
ncbi:MAG TPA: frataxin domain-containing protein [Casimicrobiaceae bacterium]|jgi:frataxin-like iron-binding protein CyaY|nr:frataxin domain-containing protein [Casimicrobiaceae bacterium]